MADELILTKEPPELPTSPLAGKRLKRAQRVEGRARKGDGYISVEEGGRRFYDFPLPPSRRPPYNREDPEG